MTRQVIVALVTISLAGCIGNNEPLGTPTDAARAANSETPGPAVSPQWWNESYEIEVTEIEASGAGPPFGYSAGRNCLVLVLPNGTQRISGTASATWAPVAPNTEDLQLAVDVDTRGPNIRRVAQVTGGPPLELQLSEFAFEDRVHVYLGSPPGMALSAMQPAELTVSIVYESDVEGTIEMSTCGATGA